MRTLEEMGQLVKAYDHDRLPSGERTLERDGETAGEWGVVDTERWMKNQMAVGGIENPRGNAGRHLCGR